MGAGASGKRRYVDAVGMRFRGDEGDPALAALVGNAIFDEARAVLAGEDAGESLEDSRRQLRVGSFQEVDVSAEGIGKGQI